MHPNALPSYRRLDYHYIAMQIGFWAMFAAICGYQAALLLERGFTNTQVGTVISVRCLAGILCQPLLGGFADRHPEVPLKRIVALSLAFSLLAGLGLLVPMGLGGTLVLFAIIGGFEVSAYPLMDAMAIQYMNAGVPIRYSLGRGLGSLAFAFTSVFLGFQVGKLGVESTLITHAILVVLETGLVISYPVFHALPCTLQKSSSTPQSIFSLLRSRPQFTLMLMAVLFGITATLPLSNFLVNIIKSRGGGDADLGMVLFVMGAAELPTAFFFQRLLRRFGSAKLLLLSMVFCTIKALALFLSFNLAGILLAQPIQMLGYGLFTPASVYFVNETVPEADRVRGQTIMMVASNGLGGVLGSAIAGWTLDLGQTLGMGDANLMLIVCIAFGCMSIALAWLSVRCLTTKTA